MARSSLSTLPKLKAKSYTLLARKTFALSLSLLIVATTAYIPPGSSLFGEPKTAQAAWDIHGISFDSKTSSTDSETQPTGVFMSTDGTNLYVTGPIQDRVRQYTLSTPWDVSTASFLQSFSTAYTFPDDLYFRSDGLRMYVLDSNVNSVGEYTLSSAWDISTASLSDEFNVNNEDATAQGLFFKSDGTKMYVAGDSGNAVYEYNLSSAWSVSSATSTQSLSINSQESLVTGVSFNGDGDRMYIIGLNNDTLYEYALSVPWDVSSAALNREISVRSEDGSPEGLYFKPDGTKLYTVGQSNDLVYQYTLTDIPSEVPAVEEMVRVTGTTASVTVESQYGDSAILLLVTGEDSTTVRTVTGITSSRGEDVSLVRRDGIMSGTAGFTEIWMVKNPAPGPMTFTRTWDTSPDRSSAFYALRISGADRVNPVDASAGTALSGASIATSTVTTSNNTLLVDVLSAVNVTANPSPFTGQVLLDQTQVSSGSGGNDPAVSKKAAPSAGSHEMGWLAGVSDTLSQSVVALKPGTYTPGAIEYFWGIGQNVSCVATTTPSANLEEGDLILFSWHNTTGGDSTITQSGGQTWNQIVNYTTHPRVSSYWTTFNGAWSGDLVLTRNSCNSASLSYEMHVFRPHNGAEANWSLNATSTVVNAAASTTNTIPSITPTEYPNVSIGAVFTGDDNTFATSTLNSWNWPLGAPQYRNTASNGMSATYVYKIQESSTLTTGEAVMTQTTVGPDSSTAFSISFALEGEAPANTRPTISSVADTPDPAGAGQDVTFEINWSDANGEGVTAYICKANATSTSGCNGSGTWASSTATTTDPIVLTYTASTTEIGTNNYYVFVCDDEGDSSACSDITSGTFTVSAATILGDGSDPGNSTYGPQYVGISGIAIDRFSLTTSSSTDTVTGLTVTLDGHVDAYLAVSTVAVYVGSGGPPPYGSQKCSASPSSNVVALTDCDLPVTTTPHDYLITIYPSGHAAMPAPPGAEYDVTATVTSITATNPVSGEDTDSATITIDNLSPDEVTSATVAETGMNPNEVILNWSNPADGDLDEIVILRSTSGAISDTPVEGQSYSEEGTIGSSTVVCVALSISESCSFFEAGPGTYHYKIFTKDEYGNYSVDGVVPTGSPLTIEEEPAEPGELSLAHFRWVIDNGAQAAASYFASQDTAVTEGVEVGDRVRLRMTLANASDGAVSNYEYLLEYSSGMCTDWTAVGDYTDNSSSVDWMMDVTSNYRDGEASSNDLGVSDPDVGSGGGSPPAGGWYDGAWTKRVKLTVSGEDVFGDSVGVNWSTSAILVGVTLHSLTSSADGTRLAAVGDNNYIYTSTDSGATWATSTSAGSRDWYGLTSSADGTKLAATVNGGYIYTSTDSGATWATSTSAGSRDWYGLTSSADGTKLAVTVDGGYIYTSTDSGATWATSTSAGSRDWWDIASSADGQKLAATAYPDYIYTSTDGGTTWATSTNAGLRDWGTITMSADGEKIAAIDDEDGTVYVSLNGGSTWTPRNGSWYSALFSGDGTYLFVRGGNIGDYIYTSTDSGATWATSTSAGSRDWYGLTSSADGTKLAATVNGGYIYTSTNGGSTWTEQQMVLGNPSPKDWTDITSSADGTKLVASSDEGFSDYIYTSTDGGTTWTQTSAGRRRWYSLTSSSDGTKLAAVELPGYIYTSTDGGSTWTEQTGAGSRNWRGIASSADGQKLAAIIFNNYIYTSTDGGSTWTEQTGAGSRSWHRVTSSADGTKLAATVNGGYIYTSTDSGVTWATSTSAIGTKTWRDIASSADGTKLAAAASNYIYTSTDGGTTWATSTNAGSRNWARITSSADGQKLAATVDGGYIYTSIDGGSTWTEHASAGLKDWTAIAFSADGTKLVAGEEGGYLYTSTEQLTDFPVYVNLADLPEDFHSNVKSDGGDIRITTSDAETEVPREVVFYDAGTDTGELHFKAPTLSSTEDTEFYIYYGNSSASDYAASATYGAQNVWTNGYEGVWHLGEDGNNTAGGYKDSTANGNHGTGTSMTETSDVEGKVGTAQTFDGSADHIFVPAHSSLQPTETLTLSAWVKRDGAQVSFAKPVWYGDNATTPYGPYGFELNSASDSDLRSHIAAGSIRSDLPGGNVTNATWLYYAMTYDRITHTFYRNAQVASSSAQTNAIADYDSDGLGIGDKWDTGNAWLGEVDEVRISSTVRSAEWIETEYNNQSDTSTFFTFDDAETYSAGGGGEQEGWYDSAWTKRMEISIDGDEVEGSPAGVNWTEQTSAGSRSWYGITSSADGTKLAAAPYNAYIYTSTDGGVTWATSTSAGSRNWYGITSSADGTKLAAAVFSGYIYTSTDGGVTWATSTSAGSRSWYGITSSADGTKLAAAPYNAYIYTSTDGGVTWATSTSAGSRSWQSITSSADGTKLAATTLGDYIYTSTDGGATWATSTSAGSRNWYGITSSADGTKLAATEGGGSNYYIYTSTDGGVTWATSTNAGEGNWRHITSSADGTKLAAAVFSGYIYTSTDGGVTWATSTSAGSRSWRSITSSADGSKFIAASNGYIYTSSAEEPTDFPVYVDLSTLGDDFWSNVGASCADVRVTTSDGDEVPREIVYCDTSAKTGELHFKAPALSASSDTGFYLYFGNSEASDHAADATYGAQNVWTNGYVAVYHFGDGTTLSTDDSTAYNEDGTNSGVTATTNAQVGGAAQFGGSQYINIPYNASNPLHTLGTSDITISTWMHRSSFTNNQAIIDNSNGSQAFRFLLNNTTNNANGRQPLFIRGASTFASGVNSSSNVLNSDVWQHVVITSTGGTTAYFVDSASAGSGSGGSGSMTSSNDLKIGQKGYSGSSSVNLTGLLDEIRIATTSRSEDWLATEYANQSSPSTFYATSTVETYSAGGGEGGGEFANGYSYRRELTIPGSLITGNLTDFPVLVSGTHDFLKTEGNGGKVANENGYDIVFASDSEGSTTLAFEREKYVSTTGEILSWVKIPTLTSGATTTFYMFYGNASTTTDQASSTAVWDEDFVAVYHMTDSGSGTLSAADSTTNARNGTVTSMIASSGKVGSAAKTNSSTAYIQANAVAGAIATGPVSFSAWIRPDANHVNGSSAKVIARSGIDASNNDIQLSLSGWATTPNDGKLHMSYVNASAAFVKTGLSSKNSWTADTYYYVAGTYDPVSGTAVYADGALEGSAAAVARGSSVASTEFRIMRSPNSTAAQFAGSIDELRVSKVARSAEWIAAEYANQNSPSTFVLVGDEVAGSGSSEAFVAGFAMSANAQTPALTLPAHSFTELEFSIRSTSSVTPDEPYCFRVTNAGDDEGITYTVTPKITVAVVPAGERRTGGGSTIEQNATPNPDQGGGGPGGGGEEENEPPCGGEGQDPCPGGGGSGGGGDDLGIVSPWNIWVLYDPKTGAYFHWVFSQLSLRPQPPKK